MYCLSCSFRFVGYWVLGIIRGEGKDLFQGDPVITSYSIHYTKLYDVAGLLGMSITGDAFNLFVFMEIASLSSYVLIALGRDRRALLASFQYLIV